MKELAVTTTTFEVVGGFRVDIVHDSTKDYQWEAWLYHERIGIKDFMFGCKGEDHTFSEFVDLVIGNFGDYVGFYFNEYMYEDEALQAESEATRIEKECEL